MEPIYLTNTSTKKKEKFTPLKKGKVGIYSCGPTVYWNQHIGHMYAYIQWDVMVRLFRYLGYDVRWVMNITDVGHMTSDADEGEDKIEKGAEREGISVWEVADKYLKQFRQSMELLNIQTPDVLSRATEHIDEQIELIKKIEKNGFAYKTKTGLVFNTSKFANYTKFAQLNLDKQRAGSRVEVDPEKKQPEDFLLWVTNKPKHIMQWDSPWGRGFPGWHIECTAMSVKYLENRFDIHTGGIEHIPVHHTNEIAQGYGAFKSQTAKYWLHNAWLTLKGEKMSKSKGTMFTVKDLVDKGYNPMHFRYLVLTSHYRKGLVFSWRSLDSARSAYVKLGSLVQKWREGKRKSLSKEKLSKIENFREKFITSIANDLNYPEALAALWGVAKSNIPDIDKRDLVLEFDKLLGLQLDKSSAKKIPSEVNQLVKAREMMRQKGEFEKTDKIREKVRKLGYELEDTKRGTIVKAIQNGKRIK